MLEALAATVAVFALVMLGLGLGVLLRGKPLSGTCAGGLEQDCHCGPVRRMACRAREHQGS